MVKKGMKYTRTQTFHDATRHMTYLLVSFFVKPSSFLQFSNRNTRAVERKVKYKKESWHLHEVTKGRFLVFTVSSFFPRPFVALPLILTDILDLSPKIVLFNGNTYLTELQRIFFGASSNEINNNKTLVIAGHFSQSYFEQHPPQIIKKPLPGC